MSFLESDNIQLMGGALIVLSLALLFCWYQSKKNDYEYAYMMYCDVSDDDQNKNTLHEMENKHYINHELTDDYKSTSSKMKTAEKKGIKIITYGDFKA